MTPMVAWPWQLATTARASVATGSGLFKEVAVGPLCDCGGFPGVGSGFLRAVGLGA
jgi:hypothetical protein